ncbi:hypothetical protein JO965_34200 (plasmid) [Microvirga sp. VF16]|nr:hypothetical protein JO965_34200 [Microvirga sp. VF16]
MSGARHLHDLLFVLGRITCFIATVTATSMVLSRGGTVSAAPTGVGPAAQLGGRAFVGYHPSWNDRGAPLGAIAGQYSHVMLSFARPDLMWSGLESGTWKGTGLEFSAPPDKVKEEVALLKATGAKVILSVGGASYGGWSTLAAEAGHDNQQIKNALTQIVRDLGLDGLDVDYERHAADAATVEEYTRVIQALREAVDAARPDGILALAASPTGSDYTAATGDEGTGRRSGSGGSAGRERMTFRRTVPSGPHAGRTVGELVDLLNIMAYDSGSNFYDQAVAYEQYRAIMPARTVVTIGMISGKHAWGDSILVNRIADATCKGSVNIADQYRRPSGASNSVERLADIVLAGKDHPLDGLMLWHVAKQPEITCDGRPPASPASIAEIVRAKFAPHTGP